MPRPVPNPATATIAPAPVVPLVFAHLLARYGPQHWWPGDTPTEVMVGAMLVQNTNWRGVELALANLHEARLLDWPALATLPVLDLAEYVRPAGYFRLKAQRLQNLARFVVERYDANLPRMFQTPLAELREQLLSVNGIGPETADSILLYAGGLPTFVIDTYTKRVVVRHGWLPGSATYTDLQAFFTAQLPVDAVLYNEFHALLVQVGKQHCAPTPKCAGCPLAELLPAGGACVYPPVRLKQPQV